MDFLRYLITRIVLAIATTWGCLTAKKMGTLTIQDEDETLQIPVYTSDAYFFGILGSEHDVGIVLDGTLFRRSLAVYTNCHFWQVFDADEYAAILAYIYHLSFSFDDDEDMEVQYDYGVELHRLYDADMWIINRVDPKLWISILTKLKELPYRHSGDEIHPVPGMNPAKYDLRIQRIQQYMQEYPEIVQPQVQFQPVDR